HKILATGCRGLKNARTCTETGAFAPKNEQKEHLCGARGAREADFAQIAVYSGASLGEADAGLVEAGLVLADGVGIPRDGRRRPRSAGGAGRRFLEGGESD